MYTRLPSRLHRPPQSINMPTKEWVASRIAIVLFMGLASVHILVAVGILPVTILWGGSQKGLNWGLRLSSTMAAIILLSFAAVVYKRIGANGITIRTSSPGHEGEYYHSTASPSPAIRKWTWVIFAYACLNTVGNLLSRNIYERTIMSSVTVVLAVCCFIVASSEDRSAPTLSERLLASNQKPGDYGSLS
jgi:K+-transporting ATPase A subunit